MSTMSTIAVIGASSCVFVLAGTLAAMWGLFLTDKTGRIQNPRPYSRPFYIWIPAALVVLACGLLDIY